VNYGLTIYGPLVLSERVPFTAMLMYVHNVRLAQAEAVWEAVCAHPDFKMVDVSKRGADLIVHVYYDSRGVEDECVLTAKITPSGEYA
jgi:hypothetical protein